jgi:hypothetical protein
LRTWWPLAASWLLMTTELPLMSAVIARLVMPEINLAAWGVIFAVSTIVQSPSTMLLAASTALCKDWAAYVKLGCFMAGITVLLTAVHLLIAFTPLYDVVIGRLIGAPPEILDPARLGLQIMTPWTFGTAYRRFQQGVLIRFDHSQAVVWGSALRLGIDSLVLAGGYLLGSIPGVVVATTAIIAGVLSEAGYAGFVVRPICRQQLKQASPVEPALTLGAFLNFYLPLAITMLLTLLVQPLVSAALSRMPGALESLAVWPVLFGLLLMWQSAGISYNEAVIALLDQPRAGRRLGRFTMTLAVIVTGLLLVMMVTPLARLWFSRVAALSPALAALAQHGLWFGLLLPGLRIWQSWYQGLIVYSRRTRGITESVLVFLASAAAILGAGVWWGRIPGLDIGILALVGGVLAQTLWLRHHAQPVLRAVHNRDAEAGSLQPARAASEAQT